MADDLMCCERLQPEPPKAEKDPIIFSDLRVLQNLLRLEKQFVPCNYFTTVQRDIKPFMRQVVSTWMLEVCEELQVEDQVLPLAVTLMDRFLSSCSLLKRHLQLVASVCMLLASKIRQCHFISIPRLCFYADHSFTPSDLKDWELLVLSKMQWNLGAVTAYDFIDHIIDRIEVDVQINRLRQHSITLIGVCCTDPVFVTALPSVMAAACVTAAARGISSSPSETLLDSICELLGGITPSTVEEIIHRIEESIEAESQVHSEVTPDKRSSADHQHPDTPTDISDIHF